MEKMDGKKDVERAVSQNTMSQGNKVPIQPRGHNKHRAGQRLIHLSTLYHR